MLPYFMQPIRPYLNWVIPKIMTTGITETDETVTFTVDQRIWRRMPHEGIMLLYVRSTPSNTALPVQISNINLTKADNSNITGSDIISGGRYLVYYNKPDNIMQVIGV